MEYQLTNEISDFWKNLVPPIFLLGVTIICFLWIIGKDNRRRIIKLLIEDKHNHYIEENGILIPKTETIEYIFIKKLLRYTGLDSIKPIVALFLLFLSFYGIGQIIFYISPPMLIINHSGILYAAGVPDEIIAEIWMQYPDAAFDDLYSIIKDINEAPTSYPFTFVDKVRSFVQFDLWCCFILLFSLSLIHRKNCSDRKIYLRLFLFICILLLLLSCILLMEMHQKNEEVEQMCYMAHHTLLNNTTGSENFYSKDYQLRLDYIKKDKQEHSKLLFYGAYEIENYYIGNFRDFVADIYHELSRFLSQQIYHLKE